MIHEKYLAIEERINQIPKFAKKNTLDNTRLFLKLLQKEGVDGLREIEKKIVHVAGTNGKGSVCNYTRELLLEDGFAVGMFISPHLVTTRERIVVNDSMISEEVFVQAYEKVLGVYEKYAHIVQHPTYFEFLFLMGMTVFAKSKLDYVILETGMGGRLDATNVFVHPALTIITEIGMDHCQYLGDTLERIAMEKAGIIKEGVPLVCMSKKEKINHLIKDVAAKREAPCFFVDKSTLEVENITNKGIDFSYFSIYYNTVKLTILTPALYQLENVSLALRGHEILVNREIVHPEKMKKAVLRAHWKARMEEVAEGVYLDGAHNVDGIEAFLETVSYMYTEGRKILIFSVVDDKNYEEMIKMLAKSDLFHVYYVVELKSSRGLDDQTIYDRFSQYTSQIIYVHNSTKDALSEAFSIKGENDLIFVVGSLYLAGEVLHLLEEEDHNDQF